MFDWAAYQAALEAFNQCQAQIYATIALAVAMAAAGYYGNLPI